MAASAGIELNRLVGVLVPLLVELVVGHYVSFRIDKITPLPFFAGIV
jgi:hypothetical protein